MADATNNIVDGVNSNDDNSITGIIEGQGSSISAHLLVNIKLFHEVLVIL
ncbi:MAG: hypothetical protein CM15mP113_0560 [Pseudomonadota bacterium]|nr:MAG: hypothetical protein CM15mP113_0560 [Pseudomonadota bacterium]